MLLVEKNQLDTMNSFLLPTVLVLCIFLMHQLIRMEEHVKNLAQLCRLCAGKLHRRHSGGVASVYLVKDYAVDIARCYSTDICLDDSEIHPTLFCASCRTTLKKFSASGVSTVATGSSSTPSEPSGSAVAASSDYSAVAASSATSRPRVAHQWLKHPEIGPCTSCEMGGKLVQGGRPAKKRRDQAAIDAVAAVQSHWAQLKESAQKLQEEIATLQQSLSTACVESGPCVSCFETVLIKHRIERQAYHSGAFIGNHVHRALQQTVIAELTSAPVATVQSYLSDSPSPDETSILQEAQELQSRYSKLFAAYASCRAVFSKCQVADDDDDLASLEKQISEFMAMVRHDIAERLGKSITPKLHLLERHTIPCMRRFGISLGLLDEQGGESIHGKFKQLRSSLENMNRDVDRLRVLVTQYLTTALPHYNRMILQPKRRTLEK